MLAEAPPLLFVVCLKVMFSYVHSCVVLYNAYLPFVTMFVMVSLSKKIKKNVCDGLTQLNIINSVACVLLFLAFLFDNPCDIFIFMLVGSPFCAHSLLFTIVILLRWYVSHICYFLCFWYRSVTFH